ncbi:hypothetical protein [Granulicella sp. WH15]|uniref:hypothetical protein n=1 Tax=Granulicella sp. WH15 TaxID=2602070 RepID=UPI0013A53D26|nr:hypothetical protein [Granulicella sp. WH15]
MAGKKTYLLAGVLLLAAIALLLTGQLTPTSAMTLLLVGAFGFPVTFRSAIKRHEQDVLTILQQIALAGVYMRSHNSAGAEGALKQSLGDAVTLGRELQSEGVTGPQLVQETPAK